MTDRFRELEVFSEIVRSGSLAAAGRKLGMSPPAVTRILASLEDRLGVRLVQRTTRALNLTEAGLRFQDAAGQLLADLDHAEREAAGAGGMPQGRVSVTASSTFGRRAVVPLFADFLNANPRVRGSVHLWDRNVNLIEEGLDVAVRIGELPDSGLFARRLGAVRRVLVASRGYLDIAGTPQNIDDLVRHRFIAFRGTLSTDRIALKGVTRSISPWIEVNDALSAISLAQSGQGVTVAMSYMTDELIADGRLIELLPDIAPPDQPVHLVWPEARLPTPAVRAFLDYAQPRLTELLGR